MTDTNNKEETFESYINSYIEVYKNVLKSKNKLLMDEKEELERLEYIKQLHDSDIKKKDEEIENVGNILQRIIEQLDGFEYEMDVTKFPICDRIQELQAEVEKLKEELLLRRDEGLSFED